MITPSDSTSMPAAALAIVPLVAIRVVTLLLLLATLLPLLPIGLWQARIFDFPRLQIAFLLLVNAIGIAVFHPGMSKPEWIGGLVVLLACFFWQLSHVVAYTPLIKVELPNADDTVRGLTSIAVVNVQFDNAEPHLVVKQLEKLDSDLLLLMEVDERWAKVLAPLESRYPHRAGVVREKGLGILLWSKPKLIDPAVEHLVSEDRASIHAGIELPDGTTFRFVGVHPTPPGLAKQKDSGRHDSRMRDAELLLIAKEIAQRPNERWLVTGDFNDVAWSHTTRLFRRISGLLDPRVGRGLYNTYHADYWLFRFPIDQVFFSTDAVVGSIDRLRPHGSDHFAIVTTFAFTPGEVESPKPEGNDYQDAKQVIQEGREDAEQTDEI